MSSCSSSSHLKTSNFLDGPFIITVVGNIGSGKSYLIAKLKSQLDSLNIPCETLNEPVHLWTEPYNYLRETEENTFFKPISQGYIFATMMNNFIPYRDFKGVLITERSVINGVYEFSQDITNPLVLHFYREMGKYEREAGFDVMININTDVKTCLKHIDVRNRDGELTSVSKKQYLELLDARHREFMNLAEYFAPEKIITVTNSIDYSLVEQQEIDNKLFTSILSRLPKESCSSCSDTDLSISCESDISNELKIAQRRENRESSYSDDVFTPNKLE